LIIDTHCHVIVAEMTAGTVPEDWRPVVSRDGGRYRLVFRGREIVHPEMGQQMLDQVLKAVQDIAMVEQRAMMEGRRMVMTIGPRGGVIRAGGSGPVVAVWSSISCGLNAGCVTGSAFAPGGGNAGADDGCSMRNIPECDGTRGGGGIALDRTVGGRDWRASGGTGGGALVRAGMYDPVCAESIKSLRRCVPVNASSST